MDTKGVVVKSFLVIITGCMATACSPFSQLLEPKVSYIPQRQHLESLSSAFSPIKQQEDAAAWGRELLIGETLGRELDLYRAVTAFKRGLILVPESRKERIEQIEYDLFLSYYLAQHYQEALEVFENSITLEDVDKDFPAIKELLIILYDCYLKVKQEAKASCVLTLIAALDQPLAQSLELSQALSIGDLPKVRKTKRFHPAAEEVDQFLCCFFSQSVSPRKAQVLNALLPGAGYYYVGQGKTAITSFMINVIFATATYQLCRAGQWGAGLIAGSLEMGWYIGGINGAGLAAKQYNEDLYEKRAKESMIRGRLFPVLMLETAF